MLSKLLRHEFRATGRIMLPVYALLLVSCGGCTLFGRLLGRYPESTVLSVVQTVFATLFGVTTFGMLLLTLVLMVLPTIISNTRESLLTVPRSYREGALALGSGKWHMIRTVVLPSALDGIITGCILSVGRITSESAALLFTAGFGLKMIGFVQALQSSSATLTVALYIYASERGAYDIAFAIAIVLMALTLALNLIASKAAKKTQEKRG